MSENPAWAIDGTNWVHVFWHATGKQRSRVLPMLRHRLAAIRQTYQPSEMYVCWDTPGPSWRRDIYPAYKGNRPETAAELAATLVECEHGIGDLGVCLGADAYEADDVLATVADCLFRAGRRVVLASPDKDLRQCLREEWVTVAASVTSNGRRCLTSFVTEAWLREEYGLSPSRWIDYQALVGDTSDNVPGCPGIGPKTAQAILDRAGTLDEIVRDPWRVIASDRVRRNFAKWVADGLHLLCRDLVTLCTTTPGVAASM